MHPKKELPFPWHSRHFDQIAVPAALQHLPNLSGMGRLRDLQQAAVLSPALATALEQYTAATTSTQRKALLDNVLIEWSKTAQPYVANNGTAVVLTPVLTQASQDLINKMRVIDTLCGGEGNDTIFASAGNDERWKQAA